VPDTSVIVDGRITRLVQERPGVRVVIAEAVVAELEHQANQGRESGYRGLEELIALRQLHSDGVIELEFHGPRPGEEEFQAIDDIIRRTAAELGGTLVTSDRIQAMVAEAKGIEVLYLRKEESRRMPRILEYFDDSTMSVHLREKVVPMAKKGAPGAMKLVPLSSKPMEERELQQLAKEIVEFARMDRDSFIEIERRGATVVQMREVRIAIAKPPFSDAFEITAVRAIARVSLEDYRLSDKLIERLRSSAEGILVAGPPGAGKSTFSQALADFYASQGKIVKTMESPRDLQVGQEISQYAPLEGDMEKTADILLLVRPDRTIYDEVRKTKDFRIFADMRLAGVGMVGVVHATKAIDALQRLIGRVELGMIPQIVDTVIFIKDGRVEKVYRIDFSVKVPHGMTESDLARPVIEVRDFESGRVEYEIYTFGDETVVMPIQGEEQRSAAARLAEETVLREVRRVLPGSARVDVRVEGNRAVVQVEERHLPSLIGRKGRKIAKLEKKLGLSIDVRTLGGSREPEGREGETLGVEVRETKQYLHLVLGKEHAGRMVKFYAGDEYLFVATIGRKGEVKLAKNTEIAESLMRHLERGAEIRAVAVE